MNNDDEIDLIVSETTEQSLAQMTKLELISSKEKFLNFLKSRKSDDTILDCAVKYCEAYSVEIETIASFIKNNDVILSQLRLEAENMNLVEKLDRLPV